MFICCNALVWFQSIIQSYNWQWKFTSHHFWWILTKPLGNCDTQQIHRPFVFIERISFETNIFWQPCYSFIKTNAWISHLTYIPYEITCVSFYFFEFFEFQNPSTIIFNHSDNYYGNLSLNISKCSVYMLFSLWLISSPCVRQ